MDNDDGTEPDRLIEHVYGVIKSRTYHMRTKVFALREDPLPAAVFSTQGSEVLQEEDIASSVPGPEQLSIERDALNQLRAALAQDGNALLVMELVLDGATDAEITAALGWHVRDVETKRRLIWRRAVGLRMGRSDGG